MNTEDFSPFVFEENSMEKCFELQKDIYKQFMAREPVKIEGDFDINCYSDQQVLKDYLQIRFIEELTEATMDRENENHFREEMADAFNFLVTAYLIYGYTYKDLEQWKDIVIDGKLHFGPFTEGLFYEVVEQVGKACNLLKNRPWKQTQYLVDMYLFEPEFKEIWRKFIVLCNFLGISRRNIFESWSLKYQVNKFRIETDY